MLFLGWRVEERNVLDNTYIALRLYAQHMTCERKAERRLWRRGLMQTCLDEGAA